MKLYLAGIYTSNFHRAGQAYSRLTPAEKYHRDGVQHVLESFHYIHRERYVETIRQEGIKIFLDSGAFSAWSKKAKIDIQAYCNYIHRNRDIIINEEGQLLASVLDAIGDAQGTYENQIAMESLGVRPLPCFHYGEDERYLEWYIARYPYITIGGMVAQSTPQLEYWLDRIFKRYICDGSGRPKLKVHGFGLTTLGLMERYPWYSVDSSSWVQIAANGSILIPGWGYVPVSLTHPTAKMPGVHITTVNEPQRLAIQSRIKELGYDPERLEKEYISRWSFNCWAFTELNRRLQTDKPKVFIGDQIGLF